MYVGMVHNVVQIYIISCSAYSKGTNFRGVKFFAFWGKRHQCLIFVGINFCECKKEASVFNVTIITHMYGQGNASEREKDIEGPWQGLLPALPLSSLREVLAKPCYPYLSWEPVRCLAGPASCQVVWGDSGPSSLLIRRTPLPPGCGIDRPLLHRHTTNLTSVHTHVFFQGHVCKCNPV